MDSIDSKTKGERKKNEFKMGLSKHVDISGELVIISKISVEEGKIEDDAVGEKTCKSNTVQDEFGTAIDLHLWITVSSYAT
jgi:hypothetical protein